MNKPELRFKAADGSEFPEWEEKKITELFTRIVEKNRADLLPLTIIQGQGTVRRDESDRRIAYDKKGLKNYKAVKKDDFIVHLRSFEGGLEIANQDGIVSPAYHVYRGGGNVCPQFYYPYFHSNNFIKGRLAICVTGVRDGKNIEMDTFDELLLPCPSLPEQKKIATFLLTIDDIISTIKTEMTVWEERKKGVMQKIFNREVRFKADDGSEFPDWEEKKMTELFTRIAEKNRTDLSPLTIIQGQGTVRRDESDRRIAYDKKGLKNYKAVKKDDFIVHLRSFEGGLEIVNQDGTVSPAYHVYRGNGNVCPQFYYPYFRSNNFIKGRLAICVTGVRDGKNIEMDTFDELLLPCPSLPEQKKIAECLSSLDDVINQIKAELSAWKEFKKGLLQQMFV